jgi:hypothetical protein
MKVCLVFGFLVSENKEGVEGWLGLGLEEKALEKQTKNYFDSGFKLSRTLGRTLGSKTSPTFLKGFHLCYFFVFVCFVDSYVLYSISNLGRI